jgi:O-antigen/teichoic acid export membrane protein
MERLIMSAFAKDVSKLASGTIFAQVLTMATAPVLTRLYGPEEYGTMSLFISITALLTLISCLCYEYAIVLSQSEKEAANMLMVSLSSAFVINAISVPVLWLCHKSLPSILNNPDLGSYLGLIPLAVFLNAVFVALSYWITRRKSFGQISVARIGTSLVTVSTQLGAGFTGHATARSLITANILGASASALVLGGRIWLEDRKTIRDNFTWRDMLEGIQRYRKFPIFETWSILLNTGSWQLPTFMLSAFFSPSVVGYYAVGNAVVRLPMSFFGTSISQVFYKRAIEAERQGNLPILVEELFRRLVIWGLFPMLVLTIVGKDAFLVFFGEKWAEAGIYVQILAVWTFFWFISSPLSSLFEALEKQEIGLFWNVLNFLTRFSALLIGGWLHNSRLAIVLFAFSGICVYGYLTQKVLSMSGVPIQKAGLIVLSNLKSFLPAGALLITLKLMDAGPWLMISVAVLTLGAYGVHNARKDKQICALINSILDRKNRKIIDA